MTEKYCDICGRNMNMSISDLVESGIIRIDSAFLEWEKEFEACPQCWKRALYLIAHQDELKKGVKSLKFMNRVRYLMGRNLKI